MLIEDVVKYVNQSPVNTNQNVLTSMLNELLHEPEYSARFCKIVMQSEESFEVIDLDQDFTYDTPAYYDTHLEEGFDIRIEYIEETTGVGMPILRNNYSCFAKTSSGYDLTVTIMQEPLTGLYGIHVKYDGEANIYDKTIDGQLATDIILTLRSGATFTHTAVIKGVL